MYDPNRIPASAARLADEIAAAVREGRAGERIEAMLLAALGEAAALERQRCAELAERRAQMWEGTRMNDPAWPAAGREEARARHREALAIADAIRAGLPRPPLA